MSQTVAKLSKEKAVEERVERKLSKCIMTEVSSIIEKPIRKRLSKLMPSGAPRRSVVEVKTRLSDLTEQEVRLARQTWARYAEPLREEFAAMVLDDFFCQQPETEVLFTQLDLLGASKLGEETEYNTYVLARVMVKLRNILDSVDQPERLTKQMTRLGLTYIKKGLDTTAVTPLLSVFLEVLMARIRQTMGKTQAAKEAALSKCFEAAFFIMAEACHTYYDLFIAYRRLDKRSRWKHTAVKKSRRL